MKPSRCYQNQLQLVARGSTIFLFLSGFFLSKDNFCAASVLLVVNLYTGYLISKLRFRRSEAVIEEVKEGLYKKLNRSTFYQKWIQVLGRGKDVFVFFAGILLGKGYLTFSIVLVIAQLISGIFSTELLYRRQESNLREKLKGRINGVN
jgi:hypothetical protein